MRLRDKLRFRSLHDGLWRSLIGPVRKYARRAARTLAVEKVLAGSLSRFEIGPFVSCHVLEVTLLLLCQRRWSWRYHCSRCLPLHLLLATPRALILISHLPPNHEARQQDNK